MALGLWLTTLAGCAKAVPPPAPPPPPNVVFGRVTLEDEPVAFGTIRFADEQGRVAEAPICSDGSYRITDLSPARYRVAVSFEAPPVFLPPPQDRLGEPPPRGTPTALPPRPGAPGRRSEPAAEPSREKDAAPAKEPGEAARIPPRPPAVGAEGFPEAAGELKKKYEQTDAKYFDPARSGLLCVAGPGVTAFDVRLRKRADPETAERP